jgi:hypothetical protein
VKSVIRLKVQKQLGTSGIFEKVLVFLKQSYPCYYLMGEEESTCGHSLFECTLICIPEESQQYMFNVADILAGIRM